MSKPLDYEFRRSVGGDRVRVVVYGSEIIPHPLTLRRRGSVSPQSILI